MLNFEIEFLFGGAFLILEPPRKQIAFANGIGGFLNHAHNAAFETPDRRTVLGIEKNGTHVFILEYHPIMRLFYFRYGAELR